MTGIAGMITGGGVAVGAPGKTMVGGAATGTAGGMVGEGFIFFGVLSWWGGTGVVEIRTGFAGAQAASISINTDMRMSTRFIIADILLQTIYVTSDHFPFGINPPVFFI
ncbi:MAG: hypothetical protein ABSA01_12785 [Anaerolineales bacterium]|jgi:hypothetical protein